MNGFIGNDADAGGPRSEGNEPNPITLIHHVVGGEIAVLNIFVQPAARGFGSHILDVNATCIAPPGRAGMMFMFTFEAELRLKQSPPAQSVGHPAACQRKMVLVVFVHTIDRVIFLAFRQDDVFDDGPLEKRHTHLLDDVARLDVVETYKRVKAAYPEKVTLNMLWGLQAALLDIPWNELPQDIKDQLRKEAGV